MKKNYLLIIVLFFCAKLTYAQLPTGKYSDYFREGSFLLGEENYDVALKNFLEAYKLDSSSANIIPVICSSPAIYCVDLFK